MSEDTLKYGSTIQLYASSALADHGLPHAVTNYHKHNLLTLGAPNSEPITFLIIPTTGANGGDVCYGERVILIDTSTSRVLNSRSDTWAKGYICLQEKEYVGELHVIFTGDSRLQGQPMKLKDISTDQRVLIEVVSSRSNTVTKPIPLTITKKSSSRVSGGYLMWDGSGNRVTFNIKQISRVKEARTDVVVPSTPLTLKTNFVSTPMSAMSPSLATPMITGEGIPSSFSNYSRPLVYGDRIKLIAHSKYSVGHSIGVYHRHHLVGVGPCTSDSTFTESEFIILSAGNGKTGEVVRYCSTLVLVDAKHSGLVWNNKHNTTWGVGYINLQALSNQSVDTNRVYTPIDSTVSSNFTDLCSPSQIPYGQIHLSFQPASTELYGFPVHSNDSCISIDVEDSHRENIKYNTRLTVYRKESSMLRGGYLMSHPHSSHQPVTFTVTLVSNTTPSTTGTTANASTRNTDTSVNNLTFNSLQQHSSTSMSSKDITKEALIAKYAVPPMPSSSRPLERVQNLSLIIGGVCALFLCNHVYTLFNRTSVQQAIMQVQSSTGSIDSITTLPSLVLDVTDTLKLLVYVLLLLLCIFQYVGTKSTQVKRNLDKFTPYCPNGFYSKDVVPRTPYAQRSSVYEMNSRAALSASEPSISRLDARYKDSGESSTNNNTSTVKNLSSSFDSTNNNNNTGNDNAGPADWEIDPLNCQVPQRYINAEKGDVQKARARYVKTMNWRKLNQLDTILDRPHPLFRAIKALTNQFFSGRGKEGNCVYYESPKLANLPEMTRLGITVDDLLYHFVYISEYLYQRMDTNPDAKCISVVDCTNIGMGDLVGDTLTFVKKVSAVTQQHYPERSHSIICINSPMSFRFVWNLLKGFLDPVTRSKTHLYGSSYLSKMTPYIELNQIPEKFKGSLDYTPSISAAFPETPETAIPRKYQLPVLPLSIDEEDMFKIADAMNAKWIQEHPGQPIPVPKLIGVDDPKDAKK